MSDLSSGIILGLLGLIIAFSVWRFSSTARKNFYQPAKLLSAAELNFYRQLQQNCPAHQTIFAKVRLADLVTIPFRLDRRERFKVLAPLAQKHVDFVIYDLRTSKVVRIVELNDSSHHRMERRMRDHFIRDVLSGAGLELVFVPARRSYAKTDVVGLFR